ncbi:MAG TPA: hypothetical protein VD866_30235 [Urbifossiella sp.]|nr:hypothetical protein [Urbifossiella sp.]
MKRPCWTLNHAAEGVYPQHQAMGDGYDYAAPNSIRRLTHDALPDFEPDLGTAVLHGHARLTDLLSSAPFSGVGYLVSGRLRAVLEGFALPTHRFYPLAVTHRNRPVEGYAWLHVPGAQLPLTDSSTVAEAEAAIDAAGMAPLDLLKLTRPSRFAYCYVSDPLRGALAAAGVTGVRFGTAKLFR